MVAILTIKVGRTIVIKVRCPPTHICNVLLDDHLTSREASLTSYDARRTFDLALRIPAVVVGDIEQLT